MDRLPERQDEKAFESLHAVWFRANEAAQLLKRRIELEAPMASSAHRAAATVLLDLKNAHQRLVVYFDEPEPCRVCIAESGP